MRSALFAIAVSLVLASQAGAQPVEARLASAYPPDTPPGTGAKLLAEQLTERGADVRITVTPMVPAAEVVQGVRDGRFELGVVPSAALVPVVPDFGVFGLPFAFADLGQALRFQAGEDGRRLLGALDQKGLRGLAYWPVGMAQLFSQMPIRTEQDLRGRKILGPGPVAGLDALGARGVPVPAGEVASALDRGLADTGALTPATAERLGVTSHLKVLNGTNQQFLTAVVVANPAFWGRLTATQQATLGEAVAAVARRVDDLAVRQLAESVGSLSRQGVEVVVPDASAFTAWRRAVLQPGRLPDIDPGLVSRLVAAATEGGGDACRIPDCRCPNRSCSVGCCRPQ